MLVLQLRLRERPDDQHRPERPVLLAVDPELAERPPLGVGLVAADPVGSVEIGARRRSRTDLVRIEDLPVCVPRWPGCRPLSLANGAGPRTTMPARSDRRSSDAKAHRTRARLWRDLERGSRSGAYEDALQTRDRHAVRGPDRLP